MKPISWKGYRFAAWVGQTLLGLAVLATAVIGLFFVSLASITVPHALIRDGFYQNWRTNLIPLSDS
jgi:hypothetical protein